MELKNSTIILEVIEKYPTVLTELIKLSEKIKILEDPVAKEKIGKKATLEMVSTLVGIEINELITFIRKIIEGVEEQEGVTEKKDENWRSEKLKELLINLHKGEDIEKLKNTFKEVIQDISATEIGELEQQLIDEGVLKPEEITELCDLHVDVFRDTLEIKESYETIPGHPIHTYLQENLEATNLIRSIRSAPNDKKLTLLQELAKINTHYLRIENQLFPILEKLGISGPPQVMWAVHDEIRDMLKTVDIGSLADILVKIEDLIYKEENILFPMTLDKFKEENWIKVRQGEEEIGYIWVTPGDEWKAISSREIHAPIKAEALSNKINLEIGNLTPVQINLLLKTLPVDVTFVDENDEVAYYSATEDRIFPRSRGIIGRNVQKCHPPKSLHVVNDIVEKFKSGEKDIAEFWIQLGGKFILIRYFAVKDDDGKYIGTLEVSQDITTIKTLEGERRLVNWIE